MIRPAALLLVLATLAAGCRQDMHDQAKYEPLEPSDFFGDGQSSRPLIEGTVARGFLREDSHYYQGRQGDGFATALPMPITADLLRAGRKHYDVQCAPCHDGSGRGLGRVVQRGMKQPESFHNDRLRAAEDGYFFHVISEGFGVMYPFAYKIKPKDRWAIVAYIRALQLSQYADAGQLSSDDIRKLDRAQ